MYNEHFYFAVQLIGGFALRDRLNRQAVVIGAVSSPPPGNVPWVLSRIGFIPAARRFPPKVANLRSLASRQSIFKIEKSDKYVHSVIPEMTDLISVGTRTI